MPTTTILLRKRSKKEYLFLCKEKKMVRIFLSVGHAMNMVIMYLSFLKEKGSIREDSNLEGLEISYMIIKKKKKKNLMKEKVNMNWDL